MEEKPVTNESKRHGQLLQGHVALITGASRGIGAATARLFARHGAAVGVNYHAHAASAAEVVEAIRAFGGRAIAVQASVDHTGQIENMVQQVEQELGPIDTLIMNAVAAREVVFGPFLESQWETYQDVVMGELAGVYFPARAVAPLMVKRKRGNLIVISSLVTRTAEMGSGAHAAGKASVDGLAKVLVNELGPHGIRVNIVAPGPIETEASAQVIEHFKERYSKTAPLRRIGQPEDVAGAILLLATQEAQYIAGSYLAVGGGTYTP
jgi:3-oxoacyl-[acyl-carrier protein] reductase